MQALERLKPLALLLLRLGLGIIFITHGYPKLFTHTQQAMQFFAKVGLPGYFVYIAGVLEVFGGILLIVGLFTRVASVLLAGEMAVALWKVHGILRDPMAVNQYEFPLSLCLGCFALATIGAGLISLDHAIYGQQRSAPKKSKGRDKD
jgi:putative oxidoreductase